MSCFDWGETRPKTSRDEQDDAELGDSHAGTHVLPANTLQISIRVFARRYALVRRLCRLGGRQRVWCLAVRSGRASQRPPRSMAAVQINTRFD